MVMSLALLHTGGTVSWTSFSVHPSTVIGIIGLGALYEYGARAAARGPRPVQRWWYYLALIAMFFSLNGWLHDLSDTYLFAAHMVQHLVLMFVVAPLMVMGATGDMLRPLIKPHAVRRLAEFCLAPIRCFAIFVIVV